MLFERLSTWVSGRGGLARWKRAGLTSRDLQRARFRCLEEVESVRYSIQDLEYAGWHLAAHRAQANGWSSSWQKRSSRLEHKHRTPQKSTSSPSKFGPALRRHIKELHQACQTYGPAEAEQGLAAIPIRQLLFESVV